MNLKMKEKKLGAILKNQEKKKKLRNKKLDGKTINMAKPVLSLYQK